MAICTQCGTLMHDDDMTDHKCKDADKPLKGQPKRANMVAVV